jgi:hypothetical protein
MPEPMSREQQAASLRARFPRWRIWWVPRALDGGASWHAQPSRYPLNAGDPKELSAAIEADETGQAPA